MFHPSGPELGLKYDSNFTMNTRSDMDCLHRPPTHEENMKVYVNVNDQILEAKILSVPVDEGDENFVVHITTTGDIKEFPTSEIMDHDPTITPTDADNAIPFPLLPWIKYNAKVLTLYLPNRMTTPKQGFFLHLQDEEWIFQPGQKPGNRATLLELPDFKEIAQSMVNNKKLFNGWKNKNMVITACIIARHVSATGLSSLQEPTLYKHHNLPPADKLIWDRSYTEEYNGLMNLDTWDMGSYNGRRVQSVTTTVQKSVTEMAISTIKKDGDGTPDQIKYRIVALRNLNPHNWTKSDCFAPVLSQSDLCLLTAIATGKGRKVKSCDVSQAFCQSYLPEQDKYVCRPPP